MDGRPTTMIILAPGLAGYYEYVKPRQEATGESVVVLLDRRQGERRMAERRRDERRREVRVSSSDRRASGRRQTHRRSQPARAAEALMSVLGFSILHREGDGYIA